MTFRKIAFIVMLLTTVNAFAVIYPDDFKNGWGQYVGKTITFEQRMYLCARNYNSTNRMYISHKRIHCEEETGDDETGMIITLTNNSSTDYKIPAGAYVDNLTAYVNKNNNITVSGTINWQNTEREDPPTVGGRLKVVTANIQKYFYHWDKSDFSECASAAEFTTQTNKIVAGLLRLDADIYAIQEVEETPDAIAFLVDALNADYGSNVFSYVADQFYNYNYTKSAYIYRNDKVETVGGNESGTISSDRTYVYRMRIQCFREKATGEKFVLSVNHFKAKDNSSQEDEKTRMQNAKNLVSRLKNDFGDKDILIVGDLNNYSAEEPCQYLVSNGYIDQMMKYSPDEYSYCYNNMVGYLDHAFANSTMSRQITGAAPYHINTDFMASYYGFATGNQSMYRYSDHDPIVIGLNLRDISKDLLGDANTDGVIDVADITTVAGYILSPGIESSINLYNADANEDGVVDVADITTIASIILSH